jgi:hypothetical protein
MSTVAPSMPLSFASTHVGLAGEDRLPASLEGRRRLLE